MTTTLPHFPVLLNEVLNALAPHDGGIYIDGTFGAGSHTRAILDAAACVVYAIDRDPISLAAGRSFVKAYTPRLTLIAGCFGAMDTLLAKKNIGKVDGIVLDIGVSSMQIDRPERGFSFRFDGPLDMRMSGKGKTASDLINELPESELADIIYRYGEERASRRIARTICAARRVVPITRTAQLAKLVHQAVSHTRGKKTIDSATRTFQGLRIAVNDELGELNRGLTAAERLLVSGGRLAVVSFHSLEDRIVKMFLRKRSGQVPRISRHFPDMETNTEKPTFKLLKNRAIKPSDEEISINPRARSARLRIAERINAPAQAAA